MSSERTIAKPLSGPEIVEAACYKLRENLSKNCLLAPHQAYGAFSVDIVANFKFNNPASLIKEASGFAHAEDGVMDPDTPTLHESIVTNVPEMAPNEVRRDTEQGVPTIVKTPQGGAKERRIKYAKKETPDVVGDRGKVAGRKGRPSAATVSEL